MLKEFKEFIMRGNVMDLAVAVIIGGAFGKIISSLVTDIIMPEKEGIETIIELRQRDPNIKIIAISGGGRTSNQIFLDVAKKFGAIDVLAKPFAPKQLLASVEKALTG